MLYSYAGPQWVAQTVEAMLEIEADDVSPAAIALMALSWTAVITTNIDRMIELAHAELERQGQVQFGVVPQYSDARLVYSTVDAKRPLVSENAAR